MNLVDAVIGFVMRELAKRARRTGTVTGTSGTRVVVTVDGASMTLPRLASYTPVTNGDVVHIDCMADGWLVTGKTA